MPNGTSGTFHFKRVDLAQLIDEIGGDLVVGEALVDPPRSVTASGLKQSLQDYDPTMSPVPGEGDDVLVTEQDQDYFILHLSPWVSIEKESPLFQGLERLREDWQKRLLEKFRSQ